MAKRDDGIRGVFRCSACGRYLGERNIGGFVLENKPYDPYDYDPPETVPVCKNCFLGNQRRQSIGTIGVVGHGKNPLPKHIFEIEYNAVFCGEDKPVKLNVEHLSDLEER